MDVRLSSTLVAMGALLTAHPATAKTPDGFTPAVEPPCDVYHGRAYGLCVSYCEARDCEHPETRAAERSCERTARLFERFTGERPPCEAVECTAIEARDDTLWVPEDAMRGDTLEYDLFANDTTEPPDAEMYVAWTDADDAFFEVADDGFVLVTWPETFFEFPSGISFEYEACCAEDVCDDAYVEVLAASC